VQLKAITDHAMSRYAERIADREGRTNVASYVAMNKEKIDKDLQAMAEYAEEIYRGPGQDKKIIRLLVTGTWLLLLNQDNVLVTLFKKDLGVDDERLNKEVMLAARRKIEALTLAVEDAEHEIADRWKQIDQELHEAEITINQYRKLLEEHKAYMESLTSERNAIMVKSKEAQAALTTYVNEMIGQKYFGL